MRSCASPNVVRTGVDRLEAILRQASPVLFTVPSADRAFAEFVRRIGGHKPPGSPFDLQERLRRVYPRVLVRPRVLANDDHIWYVYREGRWVDGSLPDWFDDESMPRLDLDLDGFIANANAAAGEEFGTAPARLVHRHFTDFAVPGSLEDAVLMRKIIQMVGQGGGTIRHVRADGEARVAELHSVAKSSGSSVVIRPIGPSPAPAPSRHAVALTCTPSDDGLFGVVVEGICARIPEPTPEGLELRLRRTYAYATVHADEPAHWRVVRDPRPDGQPVNWDDPGLLRTVALDTSLIVEANEPALRVLGQDLVGRHWHELALPSSLDQRLEMRDYYVEHGGAESTFRLVGATGDLVDYDYRLSWQGDRFTTVMAPFTIGVEVPAGDGASA